MSFFKDLSRRSQSGQAALMIAMMILIFLFLFQFVVNVGLLVSSKINLQNAADMAAYAGAATQARQLNQIGYLNYEMRRQYKKFLFRYYVVGTRAQKSWAKGTKRGWSPDNQPGTDFKVPTVCVIYNENDNFCQRANTGKIPQIENVNPLNVVQGSFNTQLEAYEKIRQNECKLIGQLNRDLLMYWLYKSTPNEKELEEAINALPSSGSDDKDKHKQRLNTLRLLIDGIGLVPRMMFLNFRINTLADYINQRPLQGIKIGQIDTLNGDDESQRFERSIQAFLSAYHTLGDHTFSASDIIMDELLPEGEENNADMIKLKTILGSFEAYYLRLVNESGKDFADGTTTGASDCLSAPQPIPVRQLPLGVYKDPKTLTYYAVRLKAPVRLLFNPFGRLEMKAYSLAKPFGSRIGPRFSDLQENEKQNEFVIPGLKAVIPHDGSSPLCTFVGSIGGNCFGIPNLPMKKEDQIQDGFNWIAVQTVLDSLVVREVDGSKGPARDLTLAYQAAMAPNPYEKGKYLIPHDLEGSPDPFQKLFDDEPYLAHGMWAPIENLAKKGSLAEVEIDKFIQTLPNTPPEMVEFKEMLSKLLKSYLNDLNQGKGEPMFSGGPPIESFSTIKVQNPVKFRAPAGSTKQGEQIFESHKDFFTNKLEDLRTSWMSSKYSEYEWRGRVGYSVKFMPFKSLLDPSGESTDIDGSEIWTNTSIIDAEAERDLGGRRAKFIEH